VYGLSGIGEGNLGYMVSRIVLCVLFCIIGTILLVMKRKWRSQEKFNPESNGIWN